MLYPKALQNYFYFINGEVVYDISTNNDKDLCGQQMVVYDEETGKIDEAANERTFYNVKVTTNPQKTNGSGEFDTTATNTYYFWYQYLISDGDTFSGGRFAYHKHNENDPYTSYEDILKESINEDIESMVSKGYTLSAIKANLPWWVYAQVDDEVVINGKKEKVKTNPFASNFDENDIAELINTKINEMVTNYANEKLKKNGLKICDNVDVTSGAIPVDQDCE